MIPRNYLRVSMRLAMKLTGVKGTCRILDASPAGFQIRTRAVLKPGVIYPFQILLPGENLVRGRLTIRWARSIDNEREWTYGAKAVFARKPSQMGRPMSSSQS